MNEVKEFFEKAALNWQNKDDISLIKELLIESGLKKGDKALDVGCGKGIITPYIYEITGVKVKAIDISENMIKGAKLLHPQNDQYAFECYDYYQFQDNNKYDFIIFYNAYPHFLDQKALSDKANSLLSENGTLVIAHGMSRSALFKHHQGLNPLVSRTLEAPNKEKDAFLEHFKLVT